MKFKLVYSSLIVFALLLISMGVRSKDHPCLLLTKNGVQDIRKGIEGKSLFNKTLTKTKLEMDAVLAQPVVVPMPKDAGGGYTHERHKKNYEEMQQMGILYQLYQDDKYAAFVKNMLMEYAKMYPALPLHPVQMSNYRGKLFWQGLNECVWLVHVSQAYDCIYDYLSPKDREYLEKNLFYPMVKFFSEDNKATFNKIHNHGTWAVAAVGMIGYVMNDNDLVEKSLYGLSKDGKGGFMRQLDELFSPDGYFTEGPYYQRYSMQPFIVYAQAIQNNDPQRKIFEHRDHILEKAVGTLLQMADSNGAFFLLNDALYKTWRNTELVYGTDIIYNITKDKTLLSIAADQNRVILTEAGLAVANDLLKGEAKPFQQKTILIRDGADGSQGGLGVLRMEDGDNQTCVLMKATSQGMGHGHFDKLTISLYDNGNEILKDYGAARYVNIEAKNGGHYLPENDAWAKQTIAHNTLTVNETSHYDGKLKVAEKYAPTITGFVDKENYKEVSATEENAYEGVKMERNLIMVKPEGAKNPLIVDVFKVKSMTEHQYDLSYYFAGQLMSTDYEYDAFTTSREPLGTKEGYQYLWKEALGKSKKSSASMTFLNDSRFYTITTSTNPETSLFLNRIGANDPSFNLRNEPSFMLRDRSKDRTFLTIIEPHGNFNADAEKTSSSASYIKDIRFTDVDKTQIEIQKINGDIIKVDTRNKTCVIKKQQ
ncbi:alginate lyase [Dysgonomonas alginatilytica]|uniref:Alginate lyase n=1 Tax=Dysgonomonas alginatilytica TaxID=1605892 RepID=A0A2V3PV97_9BACT|nr:alginate lyase family protein [Dysgonomonas alginatilytica]PXV68751.1 alginate lyase [Dysgonomonas alginatilytica]BAR73163.1 putative alginate lyase [uncultured bacterium]